MLKMEDAFYQIAWASMDGQGIIDALSAASAAECVADCRANGAVQIRVTRNGRPVDIADLPADR